MPALPDFALADRVVVVTGAGRGIGREVALCAARSGASIVVCSRTSSELDSLAEEIADEGGRCVTVVVDLTSVDAADDLMSAAVGAFGRVDGIVNNAGINVLRDAMDYTEAEIDCIFDLNLRSVYRCCTRAARQFMAQGSGGCIVNVTSQAGVVGAPGRAPYSAAKAGVNNLTRTLAAEWASAGIRVNAVAPTVTLTPLGLSALKQRPEFAVEVRTKILLGRPAEVREIGLPIVFLLTAAASMITGHVLVVDGGWTIV
jgi:2-deoxy-D-gluconate 3-dehydrogenase